MHPELISLPFLPLSIKSYGFMMVLGFIAALLMARKRCRSLGEDPNHINNFGTIALLAGVIGARAFHVIHYWPTYRDHPAEIFAIWSGGLEFLGGFILAAITMTFYFRRKKISALKFLDILAPAVMLGLAFGRMGCFLNGCCFGAPTDLPWAIRFPAVTTHTEPAGGFNKKTVTQYGYPFDYQIKPDEDRRPGQGPLIQLPPDFYGYTDGQNWADTPQKLPPGPLGQPSQSYYALKPPSQLTPEQLHEIQHGQYRMLPIHPAQLYSVANALLLCLILNFLFRYRKHNGQIFAVMLILYGPARFGLEALRNSSPYEFNGLTISQNLGLLALLAGIIMLLILQKTPRVENTPKPTQAPHKKHK